MAFLEFLRPRLRIFLSADIVGSTAYKQKVGSTPPRDGKRRAEAEDKPGEHFDNSRPAWLTPLAKFYRAIDREYLRLWHVYANTTAKQIDWPTGLPPELWKGNGDEVIYTKELSDHREAFVCVYLWTQSLRNFRQDLRKGFPTLDVKATAWISGFPLMNTEVIFNRKREEPVDPLDNGDDVFYNYYLLERFYGKNKKQSANLIRDFIGPSLDTGFRLCSHSTSRKFVISIDLALILASTSPPEKQFPDPILWRYDGRHPFRGVLGGNPYPIFWIDLLHDDELLKQEDKFNGPIELPKEGIARFCEKFIESNEDFLIRPFIVGDKTGNFSKIPDHLDEKLQDMNKNWPARKQREIIAVNSLLGKGEPPPKVESISSDEISEFKISTQDNRKSPQQ
jgi:hypothetical protein